MKLKYIVAFIFTICCALNVNAGNIKMFGKEDFGYNIPQYKKNKEYKNIKFRINAIAHSDNFPISSSLQGTILSDAIDDLAENYDILINLVHFEDEYDAKIDEFEKNIKKEGVNHGLLTGSFGVAYDSHLYSKNKYIFPAFFEDNLHLITQVGSSIEIKTTKDLSKHKGVYVKKGQKSSKIIKDLSKMNIAPVETYSKAFELLLTGKVDYIIGSYYSSQIEAYRLGVRNFLVYSKTAIWKNPLFIRVAPDIYSENYIKIIKNYFGSKKYKDNRDASLKRVLEIYRENTQGVVPPMYTNKENSEN